MTEDQWLQADHPGPMLRHLQRERGLLRTKLGRRKVWLFSVACFRSYGPLLSQTITWNSDPVGLASTIQTALNSIAPVARSRPASRRRPAAKAIGGLANAPADRFLMALCMLAPRAVSRHVGLCAGSTPARPR